MGKARHSKKAGTMGCEAPTYHERRAAGHGTVRERLGADSLGGYADCRLTLRPAVDPVCCPAGFLFSREAILENLLAQKQANKRRMAEYTAARAAEAAAAAGAADAHAGAALLAFDAQNHGGASDAAARRLEAAAAAEAAAPAGGGGLSAAVTIRENAERAKASRAFWVPSKAPEARAAAEAPDMETYCPASGKRLRLRDLRPVRFTPAPGGAPGEHMDPLTRDPLTNASRLVAVGPDGDVMLEETWRTCVLPEGRHAGRPVGPDDAVELQRGGTGFAAHDGDAAQAARFYALGPGSGLADLRGQHAGASSKFGLRFNN